MNKKIVCGIDEAGRGPLAGPVVAAAVILPENFPVSILEDSKKLKPAKRTSAASVIREKALDWGTGWAWPEEIDRINIHRATLLAMYRAVLSLSIKPDIIKVDGLYIPLLPVYAKAYVRGDSYIPQIQAASIIAKTTRDLWMIRYSRIEPYYFFEENKGYPTLKHRIQIKRYGKSPIHRKTFKFSVPL